jgi:hypothetical protein
MKIPFEPSRSFCYHFARYEAIPEILERPEVAGGEPFRLIDISKLIIDEHLSPAQQATMLKKAHSDREDSVVQIVKFFIPYIARRTEQLIPLGNGMFRLPTESDISDEELDDAAVEEEDADADEFDGSVYAFSFPALVKDAAPFPIKIGMTTGSVEDRVERQCKASATFDNPLILRQWKVARVGAVESAIHNVLRSRGKWRENIPGAEWFDTTVDEIESIIKFISS